MAGERITMVICDAEDSAPTLDRLIERVRVAVLRDGVTDLGIDPWNEIDQQRGTAAKTDYIGIGRGMQRSKALDLRHGCNVWINAHPAKPVPLQPGEKRSAPGPYDISRSQHSANKTDLGLTVHSANPGTAEIHVWKCRYRRWGRRGASAILYFCELTGRYSSPISSHALSDALPTEADRWPD